MRDETWSKSINILTILEQRERENKTKSERKAEQMQNPQPEHNRVVEDLMLYLLSASECFSD